MKNKRFKRILSGFMQRMRFKYRVSIINENTLEETWYTRLSRFSVLTLISAFFLATFIILTLIIFATPLKFYLPGFQDSGNRIALIHQTIRLDSIEKELRLRDTYLSVLKNNILGMSQTDTLESIDSVDIEKRVADIMNKTQREEEFVKNYEDTEKYNLGFITVRDSDRQSYVFFRPVSGVVASTFSPKDQQFGIKIITSPQETVKSVLAGRVIFTEYTLDNGWIIQIIHDNDYLSIYKNNRRLLKLPGDYVKAGESIGITGADKQDKSKKYFYFELWRKGNPVNPQDVITFRF